jgi:hypothetical protein
MNMTFKQDRMPEAEVTLRLAFWLISAEGSGQDVKIAIDGACVQIEDVTIFEIARFLQESGWKMMNQSGKNPWQGRYSHEQCTHSLQIQPKTGPDIQLLWGGKVLRVESKGGTFADKGRHRAIVAAGIGQVLTLNDIPESEERWVAVPYSERFKTVCESLVHSKFLKNIGVKFALPKRSGEVVLID